VLIYRTGLEIHGIAADPEEKSKYQLESVLIAPDGRMTACDGRAFLRICALANEPDLFTEEALGLLPGEELERPVTVPADVLKAFLAASKRKRKKGQKEQQIVIAMKEDAITLATVDGKTKRTFLIDSDPVNYPAVDKTCPKRTPTAQLILGVEEMLRMLTTLRRLGASSFECSYFAPGAALRVTAKTWMDDNQVVIDGALMPMTMPEEDKVVERPPANVDTETGELREIQPEATV
jgi:hypothetical protein